MEKLMQYVWRHGLWIPGELFTVDGQRVSVIDRGLLNNDAGPDFFNAKVEIGGKMWVGNIEIHVRASDWHRHGHDNNPSYDSVVLHVVAKDDCRIRRSNGEIIPQIVMECAPDFSQRYKDMVYNSSDTLACGKEIAEIPDIYISDWLTSLSHTRLQRKADKIKDLVKNNNFNWREAIYVTLARGLGFGTNSEPFERLARLVPLKIIMKHSDNREAVEGALFGQAGLLPTPGTLALPNSSDEIYISSLWREYQFMVGKFGLRAPTAPLGWKMSRMRPQNFPHRRIATLAMLMIPSFELGYKVLEISSEAQAREIFDRNLLGYWSHHFSFGVSANGSPRALGQMAISSLIINVIAPVQYAYGEMYGDNNLCAKAVDLLDSMKPESNNIIRFFSDFGIKCRSALDGQALIELRKEYCEVHKCLYCRLGRHILAKKVKP